jgi:hypothetical protein
LPPGDYYLIALSEIEPGEESDPVRLQQWRPKGSRFTLRSDGTQTVDLIVGR